jgi:hypothetical protein
MKHSLKHSVVVPVAQPPVSGAGGPAQRPIQQLRAVLRGLHQRRRAKDFTHMSGQVNLCPIGLKVNEGFARYGGVHGGSLSGEEAYEKPLRAKEPTSFYLIHHHTWR